MVSSRAGSRLEKSLKARLTYFGVLGTRLAWHLSTYLPQLLPEAGALCYDNQ